MPREKSRQAKWAAGQRSLPPIDISDADLRALGLTREGLQGLTMGYLLRRMRTRGFEITHIGIGEASWQPRVRISISTT